MLLHYSDNECDNPFNGRYIWRCSPSRQSMYIRDYSFRPLTHDREREKFAPKHIPRSPRTLRNNNVKRSLTARAVYWSLMFYEHAVRTAASIQL